MKHLFRQLGWFGVVGASAAATHWLVAVLAIGQAGWPPAVANFSGWVLALGVSFGGHYHLTFRHAAQAVWPAFRRFAMVSFCGFAVNEAAFLLMLRWGVVRYDILLAIVLVAVAGLTYLLSRYWAFQGNPGRP